MADLSPAAQAVLAALTQSEYELDPADIPNEAQRMAYHSSVAIRALADLVVPDIDLHISVANDCLPHDMGAAKWSARYETRRELLAIATELEGLNG